MSSLSRIALFGGTFDPIHEGHLEIVTRARKEMSLDKVIFLPCRHSPHKKTTPSAGNLERLEMIKLATTEIPWAEASNFELLRPAPSYTWETVETLKPTFKEGTELFLIIGLDQWNALPRWSYPEKLAAAVTFLVFGRGGDPTPREGYQSYFFKSAHPASSSKIRRQLARNEPSSWLPRKVSNYISSNKLYSEIR